MRQATLVLPPAAPQHSRTLNISKLFQSPTHKTVKSLINEFDHLLYQTIKRSNIYANNAVHFLQLIMCFRFLYLDFKYFSNESNILYF